MHQFDEPTTWLHFDDIRLFQKVLQALVGGGNTVLVMGRNPHAKSC